MRFTPCGAQVTRLVKAHAPTGSAERDLNVQTATSDGSVLVSAHTSRSKLVINVRCDIRVRQCAYTVKDTETFRTTRAPLLACRHIFTRIANGSVGVDKGLYENIMA